MGKKRFARVMRIARSIGEASGYSFRIEVVDVIGGNALQGDTLQAIAYSERNLVRITEELVDALTDDGLAWVIAHEVAHLEGRHSEVGGELVKQHVKSLFDKSSEISQELKEDGVGILGRAVVKIFSIAVGTGSVYLGAKGVSREFEHEADTRAVEIALDAGFDPEAGVEALVKLHSGYLSGYGFLETFLHTHPDPVNRVRTILKEVENLRDEEW